MPLGANRGVVAAGRPGRPPQTGHRVWAAGRTGAGDPRLVRWHSETRAPPGRRRQGVRRTAAAVAAAVTEFLTLARLDNQHRVGKPLACQFDGYKQFRTALRLPSGLSDRPGQQAVQAVRIDHRSAYTGQGDLLHTGPHGVPERRCAAAAETMAMRDSGLRLAASGHGSAAEHELPFRAAASRRPARGAGPGPGPGPAGVNRK
jgi:hypothetical protein